MVEIRAHHVGTDHQDVRRLLPTSLFKGAGAGSRLGKAEARRRLLDARFLFAECSTEQRAGG
jgi:hypothetical protein